MLIFPGCILLEFSCFLEFETLLKSLLVTSVVKSMEKILKQCLLKEQKQKNFHKTNKIVIFFVEIRTKKWFMLIKEEQQYVRLITLPRYK